MKMLKPILLLLVFLLPVVLPFAVEKPDPDKAKTLILVHPTLANLQRFQALIEMGIFPLSSEFQILGLYHQEEEYDYAISEAFLKEHQGSIKISLMKLDCSLTLEDIFSGQNPCTRNFSTLFNESSGIIFPGGPDFLPAIYKAEQDLMSVVSDPNRSIWESSFMFHLLGGSQNPAYPGLISLRNDYVVLGICLGMQTMNVAAGGSLWQDIPSKIYGLNTVEEVLKLPFENQHRNYHREKTYDNSLSYYCFHPIQFTQKSVLSSLLSDLSIHPFVLSSHHQCIDRLGTDIEVIAKSEDGRIIEAVRHLKYPRILGLQFHPELPDLYSASSHFKILPDTEGVVFHEHYPGDYGADFHVNLWQMIASWLGKNEASNGK